MRIALFSLSLVCFAACSSVPKNNGGSELNDDTSAANKEIRICNDTGETVSLGLGKLNTDGKWSTHGWYELKNNGCEKFIDLSSNKVRLTAESASGRHYVGDKSMCVSGGPHNIADAENVACDGERQYLRHFVEFELTGTSSYYSFKKSDGFRVAEICNKIGTYFDYSIGTMSLDGTKIQTNGHTTLGPDECNAMYVPFAPDKMYISAYSIDRISGDGKLLCINPKNDYSFEDAENMACDGADEEKIQFKELSLTEGMFRYK